MEEHITKRICFFVVLFLAAILFLARPSTISSATGSTDSEQKSSKRPFTIEDALSLQVLRFSSSYGVSPDGERVAYEVKDGYQTNAKVKSRLYFVPRGFHVYIKGVNENDSAAVTEGQEYSWAPSWSPDGQELAFYVWHDNQICIGVLDRKSGAIAYFQPPYLNGRSQLDWDVMDDKIYYFPSSFDLFEPIMPYEESEKIIVRKSWEEDPYEERFINMRRSQLWVLNLRDKKASPIMPEETVFDTRALSPDRQKMALIALTKGLVLVHLIPSFANLEIVPLDGGPRRRAFSDKLYTTPYVWSPDSRSIAYVDEGKLAVYDLVRDKTTFMNKSDLKISGPPVWHPAGKYILCSSGRDYYLFSTTTNGARPLRIGISATVLQSLWDESGKSIYLKAVDVANGRQSIHRLDWERGKSEELLGGDWLISQLRFVKGKLFFTLQNKTTPENIRILDVKTREKRMLTDLNHESGSFGLGNASLFHWKTAAGEPLKGVLILPPDYIKGRKYPVIVWVYEAFSQELHRFFGQLYNLQILASHGYAILMPDVKFETGETARSFKESVVPALDGLIDAGIADGNFGVMGWSFGGFATNILITQTTRFKAAVTSCGITDWASKISMEGEFWRHGDQVGQGRLGGTLWQVPENYTKNSPVFHLDKVQTPILLLHGTNDRNVPFSQAEEMYYGLRDLGKTAELVAYPGETHLGGDAEVWVVKDMWQRILDWFDKYLKP